MKNIALLITATGMWKSFLKNLIDSADLHFMQNHNVTYFLCVDEKIEISSSRNIEQIIINKKQADLSELLIYKNLNFNDFDYVYCICNDMMFVNAVGDEILDDVVCVIHNGYVGNRGTPENRPESLAYVPNNMNFQYMKKSFFGGSKDCFVNMIKFLANQIEIDKKRGMIAKWRDESHLNKFFILYATKILSPEYAYDKQMCERNKSWIPKIVILNKQELFINIIDKSYKSPYSEKILYCFISHQPFIKEDCKRIAHNMDLLNHSKYMIVYGGNKLKIDDDHVVHVNCADDYCSLPEKVNKAFRYAFKNFEFDYLVKIDRTIQVHKIFDKPLSDYCGPIVRQFAKGNGKWHFNRCPESSIWFNKEFYVDDTPYCLGLGYVLSRKALEYVAKDNSYDSHVYEDVYIGSIMHRNNIIPNKFNFNVINYFYDNAHASHFQSY